MRNKHDHNTVMYIKQNRKRHCVLPGLHIQICVCDYQTKKQEQLQNNKNKKERVIKSSSSFAKCQLLSVDEMVLVAKGNTINGKVLYLSEY